MARLAVSQVSWGPLSRRADAARRPIASDLPFAGNAASVRSVGMALRRLLQPFWRVDLLGELDGPPALRPEILTLRVQRRINQVGRLQRRLSRAVVSLEDELVALRHLDVSSQDSVNADSD